MKHSTRKSRWLPLILALAALMALLLVACNEADSHDTTNDTTAVTEPATAEPSAEPETDGITEAPYDEVTDTPTEEITETPTEEATETPTEEATAEETTPEEGNYMQIIPDLDMKTGMELISQKDHANGDAFRVLAINDFYGGTAENPVWRLGQWDSGPCLVANRVESAPTTITDGVGRTFAFDPETKIMTFELDTSLYYQGKPAVQGDYWPHLLIEQSNFSQSLTPDEKTYLTCDADRLVLSMDIRLTEFTETPVDGDWVRAAQFLMYFYVRGTETNDFCWFGLQLFDNRADRTSHYIGYDGGKADASGAMIFSIGSRYVYNNSGRTLYDKKKPDTSGEWVHVEVDLKPYLEDMLECGLKDGYFKADSLSKLYINGMNVGWETIATFDHTMEIKNLQLVSYIDDSP